MIRSLRQRHRWVFLALAILLPCLFIGALAFRPEMPTVPDLNAIFETNANTRGRLLWESDALLPSLNIHLRVFQAEPPSSQQVLEVESGDIPASPDPLIYWSPNKEENAGDPLEGAYLLGVLSSRRKQAFLLPELATGSPGRVILYSLGHQEKIADASLSGEGTSRTDGARQ